MFESKRRVQTFSVRIGLMTDGKLEVERTFSPHERVHIGSDAGCELPCAALRGRHLLLRCVRGAWRLYPDERLELRVARGEAAPASLSGAAAHPIGPGDRARVKAGAHTVLIQVVPSVAPNPAMFRPRLIDTDDVPFFTSLNACAVLGVALMAWTLSTPVSADTRIEAGHMELIARLVVPPRLPEIQRPSLPADGGQTSHRVQRHDEPAPVVERPTREQVLDQNPMLTAIRLMGSSNGRTDIFAEHDPGLDDVHVALDKVDGTYQVNQGGPSIRDVKRQGDRDIGQLHSSSTGNATVGDGPRTEPDRSQLLSAPPTVSDSLKEETRVVVKAGTGGLLSCYERALNEDPKLTGRVEISWEVRDGRIIHARIEDNDTGNDELGRCMTDRVRTWSYAATSNGEVSYPFVLTTKR